MTEPAETQIQRLVALVAWMSQRGSRGPIRYREAARGLGVSEAVLQEDLQLLLDLTDRYKPWLGSLSVSLTARGFTLESRGAFRRPFRLSRDEALALILGLSAARGGRALAARLGQPLGTEADTTEAERVWALGPTPGESVAQVLALARRARDAQRKLGLLYCGSEGEPSRRIIHPYQVVQGERVWYVVAWCETANAIRHFRADRILELVELAQEFSPRNGGKPVKSAKDLLSSAEQLTATVAFSPRIARWLREQYPDGEEAADGRYLVRLPVADPRWLAREVLQYGGEAEVLAPDGMREFVRHWVG